MKFNSAFCVIVTTFLCSSLLGFEQTINTVAGTDSTTNVPASSVMFGAPIHSAVDAVGNVYVADFQRYQIYKIDASTNYISIIAGNGSYGFPTAGNLAVNEPMTQPSAMVIDAAGHLYFTDRGTSSLLAYPLGHSVSRVDKDTGIITRIAGTGYRGFSGDGGLATEAELFWPTGLFYHSNGDFYICDQKNHRVRKIDHTTGFISTIAGTGLTTYNGDGIDPLTANLDNPNSVVVDNAGNVYISDEGHERIRKINVNTGFIETYVGTGVAGFLGDGGDATSAKISGPAGLSIDSNGDLYFADFGNRRLRKVSGGIITTVAGDYGIPLRIGENGPLADINLGNFWDSSIKGANAEIIYAADYSGRVLWKFDQVNDIGTIVAGGGVLDNVSSNEALFPYIYDIQSTTAGEIYIADTTLDRILKFDPTESKVYTIAGGIAAGYTGNDGPASEALLANPYSLLLRDTKLYIGLSASIRVIDLSTGIISAFAGTGISGSSGDGGDALSAQFADAKGLAMNAQGDLYFIDSANILVRKIAHDTNIISAVAGDGSSLASGDGGLATAAGLANPTDLLILPNGDLLIGGDDVRVVAAATGIISTLPVSVSITSIVQDTQGNFYYADVNTDQIIRIDGVTYDKTVIAGTGVAGFAGDGGPSIDAKLNNPGSLTWANNGDLLVADRSNNRIRRITMPPTGGTGGGGNTNANSAKCGFGSGIASFLLLFGNILVLIFMRTRKFGL